MWPADTTNLLLKLLLPSAVMAAHAVMGARWEGLARRDKWSLKVRGSKEARWYIDAAVGEGMAWEDRSWTQSC